MKKYSIYQNFERVSVMVSSFDDMKSAMNALREISRDVRGEVKTTFFTKRAYVSDIVGKCVYEIVENEYRESFYIYGSVGEPFQVVRQENGLYSYDGGCRQYTYDECMARNSGLTRLHF